jgi:hypothetical protein
MKNRIIKSRSRSSLVLLTDCISSILSLELLYPSKEVYLISPWVTNVPLLNNSQGQFRSIIPESPVDWICLGDLLSLLSDRGSKVFVLCRTDQSQNDEFLRRLPEAIKCKQTKRLHEKGLITENFYFRGSMNFTYSGVNLNDESVELTTEKDIVAHALLEAQQSWQEAESE